MDTKDQIEKFRELLETNYLTKMHEMANAGKKFLVIDFNDIAIFDHELAELLLESPDELLKSAEASVEDFELPEKKFRIRITNIPKSQNIKIRNIRSLHLNRLYGFEGIVRRSSDVRPQVESARFECPSCGNILSILQLDTKFKEPYRCTCGRKGRFRMLDKILVDAQHLVIEESPEDLEGGEQPKRISVFLKEDLVEPKMEKRTTPGSKIRIVGVVREIAVQLKTGVTSTRYDLSIDANYVEPIEQTFEEFELTEEEKEKIRDLSKNPEIYEMFTRSMAPSIYGHEDIKEALVLQLMGGIRKEKSDGTIIRGDFHILLVGDPGCISGDSKVSLFFKGMEKIKNLGDCHGQKINEFVTKIRKDSSEKLYDAATVFQKYPQQPVLKLITETGKEVICTYNQPFLTKQGWKRADEILTGTKIRVMPKIPNYIKKLAPTNFARLKNKTSSLKEVNLPEYITEDLASLYGYIIGNGTIKKNHYHVACYVNDEEKDLLIQISELWQKTFGILPIIVTREANSMAKTIEDSNGLVRQFVSTQNMHIVCTNNGQIATSLSFLSSKRVPDEIFKSPKKVVAKFISWLFEADGCAFGNGRGITAIQLKSSTPGLLKDMQLLLLYFGIHSRIIYDNLCIRRSRDIELFAKYIGFNSEKKREKLLTVLECIKNKSDVQKRKSYQIYEKVSSIISAGIKDVYDFEVPKSHSFIANGIVCHNSAKSTLLTFMSKASPKARYLSGKGSSAAGMTAAVVKDEILKGWALEAGALVLANGGICMLDEMDKMSDDETSALHEALESQTVTISKANIQAKLRAQTTVLAAANPKLGRFDPNKPVAEQINMPPALINRFDLIFPVKDIPNKETDEKIARHVLSFQQNVKAKEAEIGNDMMKKYVSYAKQKIFPKITDNAIDEIKDFYVNLRNTGNAGEGNRPIPISARQLEALVRLSEASARVRLSEKVTRQDAKRAIRILKYCLIQVGIDPETGQIDIDRISTGISSSQRSRITIVKEIIDGLEKEKGKSIAIDDIMAYSSEKGITEDQMEEIIERLKRDGEIFEPKRGFISKL